MSDFNQASQTPTSRGAIEESRHGADKRSKVNPSTGAPSSTDWSGVSSGAEGTLPTGAPAANLGGTAENWPQYGSSGGSGAGSEMSGSATSGSMPDSSDSAMGSGMDSSDQGQGMVDKVIGTASQKFGSVSDQIGEKAGPLADQATSKADAGIDKAAGGLESLAGTLREKSESMSGGQMQSIATMAADKMQAGADALHHTDTDQLIAELEAFVRRKPVESLLVAAGIGFVLSKALR